MKGKPNVERLAEDFFQKKYLLENNLIRMEELFRNSAAHLLLIQEQLEVMESLAKDLSSPYFLQRIQKLQSEFYKFRIQKSYKQKEFDRLFHYLEKIENEDKVEFLNTALKTQIKKIGRQLSEVKTESQEEKKDKIVFLAYQLENVHFLVPRHSYQILRNLPAFKKNLVWKQEKIPLFPGPGFGMEDNTPKFKSLLLLTDKKGTKKGFYFDHLLEDWAVSKQTLQEILEAEPSNKAILGKIKRKGLNYHLVKF